MVGGESVQGGKQLGRALSETTCRLPFGGGGDLYRVGINLGVHFLRLA